MTIIEIAALDNGAHRNQTTSSVIQVPEGWVAIPEGMPIPDTFPFVNLLMDGGTLVGLEPGVIPEPDPVTEQDPTPTLEEQIAALQAENARKDAQIAALSDYQDFQDELIAEMAAEVYK